MNKKTKTILGIAAFVLFIGGTGFAYNLLSKTVSPQSSISVTQPPATDAAQSATSSGDSTNSDTEKEKMLAPDFTVLDSEGNEVKLSSLVGTPIVLNFWASWCPPCKGEMPDFNKVYGELGADITFMMVDMVDGQRETIEKGQKYVADQAFTFPVYYDTKQEAANFYGVNSIPATYFIDKDGYLVAAAQSAIDEETLRKGIDMIK